MVAKGKRKAQDDGSSPASTNKGGKRRLGTHMERSLSDISGAESGGEEDDGRTDSQKMLDVINVMKHKDDGWSGAMLAEIAKDEASLNALLDEKERELNATDVRFQADLRSLLTSVLGAPGVPNHSKRKNAGNDQIYTDPRPGYRHAQELFKKSDRLLRSFAIASEAIENSALSTDQPLHFEKEKEDVARLLRLGQEVTARRIQDVLKRPEESTPRKKTKQGFEEDKLEEAADIFRAMRDEGEEIDKDERAHESCVGLYPLVHDAKKGVKKLAGNVVIQEE